MLLTDLLAEYLEQHEYGVSAGHAEQLRYSIAAWQNVAGHPLRVGDFTDSSLNAFLDWFRQHRKPDTVRTRRGNLLILWHWAYEERLTDTAPRRIRKLRPVSRRPEAWTLREIRALFAAADALPGCFHRTARRRAAWWGSLVRAAYDTGLRLADLLAIPAADVQPHMAIIQHKTGRPVYVQLRPATLALLDQTLADEPRELVWPLWCLRQTFYEHFRKLVAEAEIRPGTFKWLRRSAATQLERVDPGRGTELLGHAARSTTETWYIDRSQLTAPPLPPLENMP